MSGAVNSDALLFAASALLFLCLARVLRRGLTPRRALATGAALAIGLLTKLTFIGLLPGTIAVLTLVVVRAPPDTRRRILLLAAGSVAVGVVPVGLVALLNIAVWHRAAIGLVSGNLTAASGGSLVEKLDYLWQFYLPPLPGMHTIPYPGSTLWDIWVKGFVGSYGWLDTHFSHRVYVVACVVLALVTGLCLRTLVARRDAVRARLPELVAYTLLALGILVLVAAQGYASDRIFHETFANGQARYLFPLLPLYGAILALATRGAGTRLAGVLGVAIVVLAFAHDLFSQLLVIARFYA
jgi:4-amino-4-deoxy-L-arabinose transferase-like glycosyltransferase